MRRRLTRGQLLWARCLRSAGLRGREGEGRQRRAHTDTCLPDGPHAGSWGSSLWLLRSPGAGGPELCPEGWPLLLAGQSRRTPGRSGSRAGCRGPPLGILGGPRAPGAERVRRDGGVVGSPALGTRRALKKRGAPVDSEGCWAPPGPEVGVSPSCLLGTQGLYRAGMAERAEGEGPPALTLGGRAAPEGAQANSQPHHSRPGHPAPGATRACRRRMGTGGTQLWLQAGWWEWGRANICSSQRQQLSAVQSASPARPRRPRTQPAAICDREIGDTLGTRGPREGK